MKKILIILIILSLFLCGCGQKSTMTYENDGDTTKVSADVKSDDWCSEGSNWKTEEHPLV